MSIHELQRIKQWHVRHRREHPVEYQVWDMMHTLWLIGWVGWIPAFAFDALWIAPLLGLGMCAPTLYVAWRVKAHQANRLRCDWLGEVAKV